MIISCSQILSMRQTNKIKQPKMYYLTQRIRMLFLLYVWQQQRLSIFVASAFSFFLTPLIHTLFLQFPLIVNKSKTRKILEKKKKQKTDANNRKHITLNELARYNQNHSLNMLCSFFFIGIYLICCKCHTHKKLIFIYLLNLLPFFLFFRFKLSFFSLKR